VLRPYFRSMKKTLEVATFSRTAGQMPHSYGCDEAGRTYGLLSDSRVPNDFENAFGLAASLGSAEAPAQLAFDQMNRLHDICANSASEDDEPGSYYFPKESHAMLWRELDRTVSMLDAALTAINGVIRVV
jgi:hypothetical protein